MCVELKPMERSKEKNVLKSVLKNMVILPSPTNFLLWEGVYVYVRERYYIQWICLDRKRVHILPSVLYHLPWAPIYPWIHFKISSWFAKLTSGASLQCWFTSLTSFASSWKKKLLLIYSRVSKSRIRPHSYLLYCLLTLCLQSWPPLGHLSLILFTLGFFFSLVLLHLWP